MSVKKYLKVYQQFFVSNLSVEMSFRFSFFLVFCVEIMWLFILLGNTWIIYNNIDTFNGWHKEHFYFFCTLVAIYDQLFLGLFAKNFWTFSETLRLGTMDFILTKPISSLFSVFVRYQRISALFAAFLSSLLAIYFAFDLERTQGLDILNFKNILGLIILFTLGMILRVGIEIIIGTFMFITIEGEAINILRLNLQQFAKQPHFIYRGISKIILFYVFPLCLITTVPPAWFFGQSTIGFTEALITLTVLCVVVWTIVHLVWAWGINRYESASS